MSYQIQNHQSIITGGEAIGISPMMVLCCEHQEFNAKAQEAITGDLRIMPMGNTFIVELTYHVKKEEEQASKTVSLDPNEALLCDLGIDNFASFVSIKSGVKPFLINEEHQSKLQQKCAKRYWQIHDLMHKVSRLVINYCLAHDLGRLVIGVNREWKQEVNISKRNNQNFVMLPHSKFVDMIRYKAEEYGIEVTVREESYTPKASTMDKDVIADFEAKETKLKPVFSGKRIKRGLYRSKEGLLMNADINGATNIVRKGLGDEWLKTLLELNGGVLVDTPAVVRNQHARADVRQLLEMGAGSHETAFDRVR